jgi:hypothetical protein
MYRLAVTGFHVRSITGISIDIPINAKVTIIKGDSSTGKTKMISDLSTLIETDDITESTVNPKDIILIKDLQSFRLLLETHYEDKLIIIDKFELTDFTESIPFLEDSKNWFIVCSHRRLPKCGWDRESVLEMHHDGTHYVCEQFKLRKKYYD